MGRWDWVGRVHEAVYRRTGGRVGASLAGKPMLLLTTTGRRSGLPRTTPLLYYLDGDDPVIVASNGGQARDPAWCLNLRADPKARVQIGSDVFDALGEIVSDAERARLWPLLLAYNQPYRAYEKRTSREIPVVKLLRTGDATQPAGEA